jgi:hypothetical protein
MTSLAETEAANENISQLQAVKHTARNELNRKIIIEARDLSRFVLPALGTLTVSEEEIDQFKLERWRDEIHIQHEEQLARERHGLLVAFGVGFWFAIAWGILAAFVGAPMWWIMGWVGLGALVLLGSAVDFFRQRNRDSRNVDAELGSRDSDLGIGAKVLNWARTYGGQQLYFLLSLVIAVGLPAAAIFFASDTLTLIDELQENGVRNSHVVVLTLIGRVMQVVFVATASLLPALLFFLFDREHLRTLRNRFFRQIMRFDPTLTTRQDVLAKYRDLMEEAYGRDLGNRILPGRRSPLLLATLVIALGWTFTLLHGDVRTIDERGIASLFEPRLTAVSFAFLGAYFYGINAVLRGYVRKDLRPKTYSTLTVRIFVVVVLAWVLELFWEGRTLYVLAFLTGIVPETALLIVKEALRTQLRGLGARLGVFEEEPDPLTKLEGIDLYDRARLYDEGVTNVQGLAQHDVVELMLQTRIPVARILDWVDQAILYLHAGPPDPDGTGRIATLKTLRKYGIRTATDLDNAFNPDRTQDRSDDSAAATSEDANRLSRITHLLGSDHAGLARLQLIKDVLQDEEWMVQLRHWRRTENAVPPPRKHHVDELAPGVRV